MTHLPLAADVSWIAPAGTVFAAVVLVAISGVFWLGNLITLPGNWANVAVVGLFAWLGPQDGRVSIGTGVLVAVFLLAITGELIEFFAGAAGAKSAGASRRSTVFAIIGSMIGAIGGAIVGIPVPVVGSVLAAILFGGLGATAGSMYGEWTDGRPWRENWSVGRAAFVGKTLGTLGKFAAGLVIVAVILFAVVI